METKTYLGIILSKIYRVPKESAVKYLGVSSAIYEKITRWADRSGMIEKARQLDLTWHQDPVFNITDWETAINNGKKAEFSKLELAMAEILKVDPAVFVEHETPLLPSLLALRRRA
jgi:hypothetical protein